MFISKPAKIRVSILIVFAAFCLLFQNCSSSNSSGSGQSSGNDAFVVKGSRSLGVDILDTTTASDFNNNIAMAKSAGASQMILSLGWNQIEATTPTDCATTGTYTDPGGALATFNTLLPTAGLKLSLSILPITTGLDMRPTNLKSKNFDDSLLICRYQKMLTYVFSKIPNVQLTSLMVGNEIDAFSSATTSAFWTQYWGFFVQASGAAKTLRSSLPVSVSKAGLQQIYNSADFVAVTYYPMKSDFTVKNPSVIAGEIDGLVQKFPSKTITFNEIGFPSGATYDASSEELQRVFVAQVFASWDKYATTITSMSFLRLNDLTLANAQSVATQYGLTGNTKFTEFIQTLGLRTNAGGDKAAFLQLKVESSKRGW